MIAIDEDDSWHPNETTPINIVGNNKLDDDTVSMTSTQTQQFTTMKLQGSTMMLEQYKNQHSTSSLTSSSLRLVEQNSPRHSTHSPMPQPFRRVSERMMSHVHKTFFQDAQSLAEGTIPQSIVVGTIIGVLCGIAAFIYFTIQGFLLEFLWKDLPVQLGVDQWEHSWLWIPIVGWTMAVGVGLSVVFLGEPGDLAFAVGMVHDKGYIPMDHVLPMSAASMCSILAGGSVGPEAPLVAICGAIGGFVSRVIFQQRARNVVRKHTLMGMAGALAAFFGVPIGGSLFALEVCSRFGIEYFEHLVEAIFCGEVCLVVFRYLSSLPIAPIWDLTETKMTESHPSNVLIGGAIGLLGAAVAACFAVFHRHVMELMGTLGLLDNRQAVWRALFGSTLVICIGVLIPHSMFWGEEEFLTIATMSPAINLPHVWPTSGAIHFEMDTLWKALLLGIAKIVAISLSLAAGFRGGFIFPFFVAGASFGNVLVGLFPNLQLQLATLCFAAGINVAITRTALATTLILSFLAGEPCATPAILAASLTSLFATSYMTFLKTQIARSDIDHSLFHRTSHSVDVGASVINSTSNHLLFPDLIDDFEN